MEISSHFLLAQTAAHAPALGRALAMSRGGAAMMASASLASAVMSKPSKAVANESPQESILGISISPEGKSVVFMAIAMAFHYLGYSFARPITMALFTSASTGYAGMAGAFPFAMAFVSPMALLLLMGYGSILDRYGPRGALMRSSLFCATVINLSAVGIAGSIKYGWKILDIPFVKYITGPLFVFREAYVQLLTSQFWSFMASALTPNQSAKWFGPIAGVTSIASATAGMAVSPLVAKIGLSGTLLATGITLLLSMLTASVAYNIASKYGFEPTDARKKIAAEKKKKGVESSDLHKMGMIEKASKLFARVPVLGALFLEILSSQGLATVLNVCFVSRLGTAIPDDNKRAGWVGSYFALINIITMVLQFGILPPLMTVIEPRDLWRAIPIISLLFTGFQSFQQEPTLFIVSASLLVMKVSEYSARRMLDEMVFVPLDFESRFLGKEVIGVFGYRFGKSLMSLGLSAVTSVAGEFGLQQLSILSHLVSWVWMRTAWSLSNLVPTRQEAQDAYTKTRKLK